jgi:hypothetical protein
MYPSYSRKCKQRSRPSPGKKQDLISKTIKAKRAGDMAQVIECLPSKDEALSSISSTAKKKKGGGRRAIAK